MCSAYHDLAAEIVVGIGPCNDCPIGSGGCANARKCQENAEAAVDAFFDPDAPAIARMHEAVRGGKWSENDDE